MSSDRTLQDPPPALVPAGGLFEGQIAVLGETLIAGVVRGSLRGPGDLQLATGGRVEGVIECESVDCQGAIIGPIIARKRAHLGPGTHFEGDLEAPAIDVDEDAVWTGTARVGC